MPWKRLAWTLAVATAIGLAWLPGGGADTASHAASSPLLAPGQVFANTFTAAGTYQYHCHIHPSMTGEVRVVAPARSGGAATHTVRIWDASNQSKVDSMGFLDDETKLPVTTVRLGDNVVWINEGKLSHDVGIQEPTGAPGFDQGTFEGVVAILAVGAVAVIVWSRLRKG